MTETEHELQCRWRGEDQPRALVNRHEDDCKTKDHEDGARRCRGCLPCPRYHCVVCGIKHVDQLTCPECVSAARDHLAELGPLYAHLPSQAILGGSDGRLEAARQVPGGEALVMLSPGSNGRARAWAAERGDDVSHQEDERHGEIEPTEMWAVTWEDDWRRTRGQRLPENPGSLAAAIAYLDEHLSWAAQHHLAFDQFAADLRQQVTHLEDILHDGERDTTGAPCPKCKRPLVMDAGEDEDADRWTCKAKRCHQVPLSREEYTAMTSRAKLVADWLTDEDMELIYRIKRNTLRSWGRRGSVKKRKDFDTGRVLYKVAEAVALRDRAQETA